MNEQAARLITAAPPASTARLLQLLLRAVGTSTPAAPVRYTRPLVGVVAATTALAALLAVWLCRPPSDWTAFAVLLVINATLATTSTRLFKGVEGIWNASILIHLGVTFLFGPIGALGAAGSEAMGTYVRARNGWFRGAFNASQMFLSDMAVWWTYTHVGDQGPHTGFRQVAAGSLAGLAQWVVNHALVAAVFVAMTRRPQTALGFLRSNLGLLPYNLTYGFAALAFPMLFAASGVNGLLMASVPVMAAQAFVILLSHQTRLREEEHATHVAEVEENVQRIAVAQHSTLLALTCALDARDPETQGHSRRVVEFSRVIATVMGVTGEEREILIRGALLHDIGKIGVRDSILLKPGKLTPEEWEEMRCHPEIGARMIEDVEVLRGARHIILHHHERWDGAGYPRGLRGTLIVRGARIFAASDAIDAMTQDRPYRAASSWDQALAEILRCRETQFDPEVVDALLTIPHDVLVKIASVRQPPKLDLLTDSA